jgi:nitronate monooxygenase
VTGRGLPELYDAPIIVAPMGGGPSTPELVAAGADAGALSFLAAGYRTAADVEVQIRAVRSMTGPSRASSTG